MRQLLFSILLLSITTAFAIEVDDSPALLNTWGFRPLADSPSALNPPGFTWRPVSEGEAYILQVARDRDFQEIAYECSQTPWSAHCPDKPFDPVETYYWRYAAYDAEGVRSDWSITRDFRVAPDAVEFPQPSFSELKKRMPKEHPRIFFREEEIANLISLSQGSLASRWESILSQAERLMKNPPDTSEPPLYPKGVIRKSGEWKKIWWGNRTRTIAVTDGAATLAFVYRLTGEEKYGQAARDLLLSFCKWDPEGSTEYTYNDEAAMPALYYPSRAYSWAYPVFSQEDRTTIVSVMEKRGRQVFDYLRRRKHLWTPYESHRNRAWHFLGELALAFLDDIPEAERWLEYSTTIFYTCYPVWADIDGGWHEGFSYWKSYMSRFGFWALLMDSAFEIDVFKRPFFQRTGNYGMYCGPPGTDHCGFGDQAGKPNLPLAAGALMEMLANGTRNPHWKWYAERVGGHLPENYLGYLWASRGVDLESEPPTDLPGSICFRGVGLAVMNTNLTDGRENVQLFFKSSPMGTVSHGYNANNSIHLNVNGLPALLNTGRRDVYGSPHHTDWMWNTKSQNAILVNNEGQPKHSPEAQGRIVFFDTSPTVDVVVGEAGDSYDNLNRWTRAIVFLKPDIIVLHDVLKAPEPSTYQWLLHAPSRFYDPGEKGSPKRVLGRYAGRRGRGVSGAKEYGSFPNQRLRSTPARMGQFRYRRVASTGRTQWPVVRAIFRHRDPHKQRAVAMRA